LPWGAHFKRSLKGLSIMAKPTFKKDVDGLNAIMVTEIIAIGITRFIPGRMYRVDDQVLEQLGNKARPADD